jgi:hypothetical protein
MRGSVYYQATFLLKLVFSLGAKKEERVDSSHENYQNIASYKTAEAYRSVWENFFNYLKEHWQIKDAEQIEPIHIQSYMDYKIEYYPSKQYLEKISSAFGKLEVALNTFSRTYKSSEKTYDFSIRKQILKSAIDLKYVANNYHNRAYMNPEKIIENLQEYNHKIAARIELQGGARLEGCALIKKEQLQGYRIDDITNQERGLLYTKEKGGKVGEVLIHKDTYDELSNIISKYDKFKINKQKYFHDIRQACHNTNENPEGTHGFRWNFAKRRLMEYVKSGRTYEQALKTVSSEMKHNRASITEHYLC